MRSPRDGGTLESGVAFEVVAFALPADAAVDYRDLDKSAGLPDLPDGVIAEARARFSVA